jgi:hypothetical protein
MLLQKQGHNLLTQNISKSGSGRFFVLKLDWTILPLVIETENQFFHLPETPLPKIHKFAFSKKCFFLNLI